MTFDAGTGVLSGTPAATAGGDYPLMFTASNGVGPAATQDLDLWVVSPSQLLERPDQTCRHRRDYEVHRLSWTDNAPAQPVTRCRKPSWARRISPPLAGSPFGPGTTSATATGLTGGLTYQFEVRAVAASGPSDWLMSGDIETLVSTALSLSANPNPLQSWVTGHQRPDQSNDVTFTATVTNTSGMSDVPVGQVDFQDPTTGTDLGTVPLTHGSASL